MPCNLIELGKGVDRHHGGGLAILGDQVLAQKIRRMNRQAYRAGFQAHPGALLIFLLQMTLRLRIVDILPGELREQLQFDGFVGAFRIPEDREHVGKAPAYRLAEFDRARELPGRGDHEVVGRNSLGSLAMVDDLDLFHQKIVSGFVRSRCGLRGWALRGCGERCECGEGEREAGERRNRRHAQS